MTLSALILASILCGIPALATAQNKNASANLPGGRFILWDHNGKTVTDQEYAGKYRLVTFGYTFCPDICPTTLTTMSEALDQLGKDAEKVIPLLITVDPKRDTVKRLREYVKYFHPRLTGLTGPEPMIARTASQYKAKYKIHPADKSDKDDPNGYTVDHSASIFLMGPDGIFRKKFIHNIDPSVLAQRIRDLLAGN